MKNLSEERRDIHVRQDIVLYVLPKRQGDAVIVAVLGSPSRDDLWKESETLIVKGFEVIENKGEPVIYVSKVDDESPVMERVSYKKSTKHRKWISKSQKGGRVIKSAARHKKKKMFAKRKRKARMLAKQRLKKRNYKIAEKSGMTEIKDKNVTVVGLARSGVGAANLLSELGAEVTVTDIKTEDELKDFIAGLSPSVRLALGTHPEDIFVKTDMVVVSPGVPLDIKPLCRRSQEVYRSLANLNWHIR